MNVAHRERERKSEKLSLLRALTNFNLIEIQYDFKKNNSTIDRSAEKKKKPSLSAFYLVSNEIRVDKTNIRKHATNR